MEYSRTHHIPVLKYLSLNRSKPVIIYNTLVSGKTPIPNAEKETFFMDLIIPSPLNIVTAFCRWHERRPAGVNARLHIFR